MSSKLPIAALASHAELRERETGHAADRQIAVTLRWLEKWEPVVRSAVEKHQKAMAFVAADPIAQELAEAFPDAGVEVED